MKALEKNGLENHGEESLKDAALKWFDKEANRVWFNTLMQEGCICLGIRWSKY